MLAEQYVMKNKITVPDINQPYKKWVNRFGSKNNMLLKEICQKKRIIKDCKKKILQAKYFLRQKLTHLAATLAEDSDLNDTLDIISIHGDGQANHGECKK